MSPNPPHEALHRVFRIDETVFASAMSQVLGVSLPVPAGIDELNVDLTEYVSVDRRSDTVLRVRADTGNPADDFILLVESQTDKDETRRYSWPYYVAYLQAKYHLEVVFLVVTPKDETARWARDGFRTGPPKLPELTCQVTIPAVIGPRDTPALTSVEGAARNACFASLCALTHRLDPVPVVRAILEALAPALQTLDAETAGSLSELIEAGLSDSPGCDIWKALMMSGKFTYVSETRAKAHVEQTAKNILAFLDARGISVDDKSRHRIETCADQETLDTWVSRSAVINRIEELFED